MILIPDVAGKWFGVVGLGKSGRATVASLLASGAEVLAWDDSEKTRAAIAKDFPAAQMKPVAEWDFTNIISLVMSPGILLTHEAVLAAKKNGVEVIGDIELLWRAQSPKGATFIGITGTNGKSTTTSLIAHILKECGKRVEMGGNIGVPALALEPLDYNESSGVEGIYVLELSSYQLDLVNTTQFHIAVLLNITPDHIDHHGSMKEYIAAKCHIFDRQLPPESGTAYRAIIGIDDEACWAIAETMKYGDRGIPTLFSASGPHPYSGIWVENGILYDQSYVFSNESSDMPHIRGSLLGIKSLQGQHNWQNAAAAYIACMEAGLCAPEKIMAAMATYPGLPHRMQWLGEIGGVQFVNDSKATNADAAEKALKTYDDIYWILGGVAKEGGIETLAPYFPKIRHAYLIGEATDRFAATLEGHVPYSKCGTLEKAFERATAAAANADPKNARTRSVLLAPGCASFDQFANFEVRGEAFAALVEQYKQKQGA